MLAHCQLVRFYTGLSWVHSPNPCTLPLHFAYYRSQRKRSTKFVFPVPLITCGYLHGDQGPTMSLEWAAELDGFASAQSSQSHVIVDVLQIAKVAKHPAVWLVWGDEQGECVEGILAEAPQEGCGLILVHSDRSRMERHQVQCYQ